jgi:hypothetical protein
MELDLIEFPTIYYARFITIVVIFPDSRLLTALQNNERLKDPSSAILLYLVQNKIVIGQIYSYKSL